MSLEALFYPRGVAVIGSTSPGRLGYHLIQQLLAGGYEAVYAVNPKSAGLGSIPGYSSVAAIPYPVDMAVVVSPRATVPKVLEECGRAGVRAAVIITAGFSEAGDHLGEAEVARVARSHGIRFLGPNCAGLVNTAHNLAPTLETLPPRGGVSLIAQSGAIGGMVLAWAVEYGLGIAKFVSYGNGVDLRESELLRYMASDEDTEVVALYIESVGDGREFMEAARECTRHKPLLVVKAGRTESGRRAALSHTGSMAGAEEVYDAVLRQCGAIRVRTVEELFDACKALTWLPRLEGNRVAIVTNSGGPGVMAADWAERIGLPLAEPSPSLKKKLAAFLPEQCALRNPIDLTVEGTEEGYRRTLSTLLEEYDAALALNIAPAYLDSIPLARGVGDAAERTGKPVAAAFLPARIVAEAVPRLQERGVPNFPTGERAVTALHHAALSHSLRTGWRPLAPAEAEQGALPGSGQLLEHQAMAWLKANGLPVPALRFASTLKEALRGCDEIGYPIAMKVVSPEILHKSDVGGVILDVRDGAAAADAFARLKQVAAGRGLCGVIIYPMIRGAHEVLLGISRDPQFGPVVAFGLGGIYTEVLHDVALRVAPVDKPEARAMISEIRGLPLLQGARGGRPGDLDALADVLAVLSQIPFRFPQVGEIDLNPVFLFPDRVVVGDVRVLRRGSQQYDK